MCFATKREIVVLTLRKVSLANARPFVVFFNHTSLCLILLFSIKRIALCKERLTCVSMQTDDCNQYKRVNFMAVFSFPHILSMMLKK